MNLFTWGTYPTSSGAVAVSAGRWAFDLSTDRIGIFEQRRSACTGDWFDGGRYVALWLYHRTPGYHRLDYDGEHHVLNLGLFALSWCYR